MFLDRNNPVIAIGWSSLGNLTKYNADKEKIKKALIEKYSRYREKKGAVPTTAGMLYRFAYEVQVGDYIIYPSKFNRQINIGEVTGEYRFVEKASLASGNVSDIEQYPNVRSVKWLKNFPRTAFTQGALYEVGSAMTFFSVKNYADEYLNALSDSFKSALLRKTKKKLLKQQPQ